MINDDRKELKKKGKKKEKKNIYIYTRTCVGWFIKEMKKKKKFCLTGRVSHAHGSVRQPISTEYLIVGVLCNMHVCTPPIVINLTTKHKQRLYICICVNRSIKNKQAQ